MSVKVDKLTKVYGSQKAVNNISFEVNPGEVIGFLGPNGAGKSTTMKILACFLPQTEGSASVCGYDVVEEPLEVRKNIGYLPENNPLYVDMYVREYLEFLAALHKLGKGKRERVEQMIELTGLTPERHKKIGQLSKGFRQRVGLAQAMLHDPKVLVLDEPTSGLDPNQLVEIRELIKELGKEKTVILSTHIMQEVQAVCDRVIIINHGEIVADDKTSMLGQKAGDEVIIEVEFEGELGKESLETIQGVKRAEKTGDGWKLYADTDIRQAISAAALQNEWMILTMKRETVNLEDIFKQLTKDQ
ncbi:MAG: gliding motility-associated ABC transporter ATP-binding subunit GldA [Bacteroidetes bacterium]|nr:gliding motility-associated ABC transporter ATP-binding subunit GldA [Bacteroidota bacterium]